MFGNNVGGIDRIARIVVGVVLIACWFLFPDLGWRWIFWVGVVPLLTGLLGTCPAYSLFGLNTCPMKRD